jgi:AcrR family transcriptional regulator
MGRISKDPAVRKKELILAACELVKEKGFEQVSVSDIVKKVGVAQGTFYYYFETKYDILDAVVDHYMQESIETIEKIAADPSTNPLEKLQAILNYTLTMDTCEKNFIEFLHSNENLITHQKYLMKSFETTILPIAGIVEKGIKDGLFEVQYPLETVGLMVYTYGYLHDSLAHSTDREERRRKIGAAQDVFEKVLGIKGGSLKLEVDQILG